MSLRLLLADDHNLVRETTAFYLHQTVDDIVVVEANSLPEALEKAAENAPFDAVILDLGMPGMNGLDGLDRMRATLPGVPVVILSGRMTRDEAIEAMARGAAGVFSKELRGPALINALRLVLSGETYVAFSLLRGGATERSEAVEIERQNLGNLTRRELDIVKVLARGFSNREIAAACGLAEATVKLHLHKAFAKIGAKSRADAVRILLRSGIG